MGAEIQKSGHTPIQPNEATQSPGDLLLDSALKRSKLCSGDTTYDLAEGNDILQNHLAKQDNIILTAGRIRRWPHRHKACVLKNACVFNCALAYYHCHIEPHLMSSSSSRHLSRTLTPSSERRSLTWASPLPSKTKPAPRTAGNSSACFVAMCSTGSGVACTSGRAGCSVLCYVQDTRICETRRVSSL